MIYSENLTYRDRLRNAMPLKSLSREQWKDVTRFVDTSADKAVIDILNILLTNQSRIEVMNDYCVYYGDTYDKPVREESIELILE